MRISDWSSDVCSSDLPSALQIPAGTELLPLRMMIADSPGDILNVADGAEIKRAPPDEGLDRVKEHLPQPLVARRGQGTDEGCPLPGDRKRVVWGTSESVSVDIGGRRKLKQQIQHTKQ